MHITLEKCWEHFYKACKFIVPKTNWKTLGVLTFKGWWRPKRRSESRNDTTSEQNSHNFDQPSWRHRWWDSRASGGVVKDVLRLARVTDVSRKLSLPKFRTGPLIHTVDHIKSNTCMVSYLITWIRIIVWKLRPRWFSIVELVSLSSSFARLLLFASTSDLAFSTSAKIILHARKRRDDTVSDAR